MANRRLHRHIDLLGRHSPSRSLLLDLQPDRPSGPDTRRQGAQTSCCRPQPASRAPAVRISSLRDRSRGRAYGDMGGAASSQRRPRDKAACLPGQRRRAARRRARRPCRTHRGSDHQPLEGASDSRRHQPLCRRPRLEMPDSGRPELRIGPDQSGSTDIESSRRIRRSICCLPRPRCPPTRCRCQPATRCQDAIARSRVAMRRSPHCGGLRLHIRRTGCHARVAVSHHGRVHRDDYRACRRTQAWFCRPVQPCDEVRRHRAQANRIPQSSLH